MHELESFKNIQRSILNSLLRVLLFISALALTAISMEEIPRGEYVRFFLIYLPSFMMLMAVTLVSKKIPFNLRVYILISLIMLIGVSEMFFWGFSSMAFYFFLSAAVIAAIINSPSLGWITFSCSLLIIVVFMLLYSSTSIPEYSEAQLSSRTLVNWIAPFIAYIMLQVAILLIIQIIISHLIKTLIISSKEREELEQVAFIDTVTGLPNNQKVIQDIGKIIAGNEGSSFKIHQLLIEILDFEDINIKYGLDTGNYILKIMANRLLKLPECVVYRMTGSKFLIHCTKENELENERTVEQVFKEPISAGHHIVAIHYRGASIRYPEDINNPTLLISNLMLTLNNAKSCNRDVIINYSETNNRKILRENDMKDLLVNAVNKNEISVYIQPRMDAKSGLITGGELLMRWFNSKFGTISPTEFIPIAEKDDMIFQLTDHLMSISQNFHEYIPGYESDSEPFNLSVNISPIIVQTNRLSQYIPYSRLLSNSVKYEFELTEGVFLGLTEAVWDEINKLHNNNITVSIDDFGTGYSNLEYLQNMNIDILKIDKKFVDGIPHDTKQTHLVKAIIQMAKALNLKTVAEGVEFKEQLLWLQNNGIDEIQGFLLAKPMDLSYFRSFYSEHNREKWINASQQ